VVQKPAKQTQEKEPNDDLLGVDFHPEFQQIPSVDTDTRECHETRLENRAEAQKFYVGLAAARHQRQISKQEWTKFMEAEFDRLDKDEKVRLNVKGLTQSKSRVGHPVKCGEVLAASLSIRTPDPTHRPSVPASKVRIGS